MNAVLILLGQFLAVFLLGFQSRCVNSGKAGVSFCTSMLIGMCQVWMFKSIPAAQGWELLAFLLGGPCGIVASIYAHRVIYKTKKVEVV